MNEPARSYTSILITGRGVVLFAQHLERISRAGKKAAAAFRAFAETAAPGVYAIYAGESGLEIQPRGPSALRDGQPVRFVVSPYADLTGRHEKPAPPSPYNPVRIPGVATLLTSRDGAEIFESCAAGVIALEGTRLFAPPEDRPAVRSAALVALAASGLLEHKPILAAAKTPLALVNAVGGIAVPDSGRQPFPAAIRAQIEAVFLHTTSR